MDERSLARKSGDLAKNTGLALTSLTSDTIVYLAKGALKTIGLTFAVAVGGFAALQANEAVNGATSYEAPTRNNDNTDVNFQQLNAHEPPEYT